MHKLEINDVLLSKHLKKTTNDGFCIFDMPDFLPLDFYSLLHSNFPPLDLLVKSTPIAHRSDNKFSLLLDGKLQQRGIFSDGHNSVEGQLKKFFDTSPEWLHFMELMSSPEFVYDAIETFKKEINKSRGLKYFSRKKFYSKDVKTKSLLRVNISINFMFSAAGESGRIYPHTDAKDKLISLLLYLPKDNWSPEYKGETTFYKLKNKIKYLKWAYLGKKNVHVKNKKFLNKFNNDHKVQLKSKYVKNMLVGFIKNKQSWHSLGPIVCGDNNHRRVFMINIKWSDS